MRLTWRFYMKKINLFLTMLLLACFSLTGYAAGGPLEEDFSKVAPIAQRAIDAGKQGDADTFLKEANEALAETQSQPDSARRQRILTKIKKSIKQGEAGRLTEAVKSVEAALPNL